MIRTLRNLLTDTKGNTLAIFAAALVPLVAMIGSGLDLSFAYMAKAKLQNACDAAVLAGRQSMDGNFWKEANEAEARKFFNFNFPNGTMGAQSVNFTVGKDPEDNAQILGVAKATIPTALMHIFGFDNIPLEANCDAKRDLGHNDVVLVLDVTGSMANAPSSGGGTKIARLQQGALGLYRALMNEENGSITRFGIVPYSHTVNVGASLADSDIRNENDYVGQWQYAMWTRGSGWASYYAARKPSSGWADDDHYIDNGSYHYAPRWRDRYGSDRGYVGATDSTWGSKSNFRSSGGCIEERPSYGNAADPIAIKTSITLNDVDMRASGDTQPALQFGRYDPNIQNRENQTGCPSPAIRLRQFASESSFKNDGVLRATANVTGGTYHDVGMLWGLRFISQTGFFNNTSKIDDVAVDQHIVFMTDGMLDTDKGDGSHNLYTAHGLEFFQDRTKGTGTNRAAHIERFRSACNLAKSMGVTVWVIALDVTDTDDVRPCATTASHFYTSDGSDLEEIFENIGRGIGNLRLTR